MNMGTESTNPLETIDFPRPYAETSSTPSPSLLQEQIPSNSVDPLTEIFPSQNKTPSCEFQDFVAPIVNKPEKIRSVGCTPEPEPGCCYYFGHTPRDEGDRRIHRTYTTMYCGTSTKILGEVPMTPLVILTSASTVHGRL
ncbi:hypothetical protein ACJJTC_010214 [Scirpophaga incertulas]